MLAEHTILWALLLVCVTALSSSSVRSHCDGVQGFCSEVHAGCQGLAHDAPDGDRETCTRLWRQCRGLRSDCYRFDAELRLAAALASDNAVPTGSFDATAQLLYDLSFAGGAMTAEVAQRLLELGADPNGRCRQRNATALHLAVSQRRVDLDLVNVLLTGGADPNAPNGFGETPLHLILVNWGQSVPRGPPPIAPTRCAAGGRNDDDNTTSMSSSEWSDVFDRIATVLLEGGADAAATDQFGHTALHVAATTHNMPAISLLRERQGFSFAEAVCAQDAEGRTPLHLVAGRRDWLQRAANEVLEASYGRFGLSDHSALRMYSEAAFNNLTSCADALYGLDLACDDGGGRRRCNESAESDAAGVLVTAIELRDVLSTCGFNRRLIGALGPGAEACVDVRDKGGSTPLHVASAATDTAAVVALLNLGADRSVVDKHGRTPAALAEMYGSEELRVLLSDVSNASTLAQCTGATPNDDATVTANGSASDTLRSGDEVAASVTTSNGGWVAFAESDAAVEEQYLVDLAKSTLAPSHASSCAIDRVPAANMAPQRLWTDYVVRGKPVIIEGLLGTSANVSRKWRRESFVEIYGAQTVHVGTVPYPAQLGLAERVRSIDRFVAKMHEGSTRGYNGDNGTDDAGPPLPE